MFSKFIRNTIATVMMTLTGLVVADTAASAPLAIHPYRADSNGFNVASVLVTGTKEAVLIDAQYTQADAHRLVAEILASGMELKIVYISQADPDYYFGLEVIKQTFPNVKIFATKATIDHIKATMPGKLKLWGPQLGANGPKHPIIPQVLAGNSFELEGQKFEIMGSDGPSPLYTFIWIPSIKAIVGGVRIFGDMHLWMTDVQAPLDRQYWVNDLQKMVSLKPEIVIPGHAKPGSVMDVSSIRFSEEYLKAYGEELPKAGNAAALISAMKQRYPDAIGDAVLDLGAKVNKGEIKWAK